MGVISFGFGFVLSLLAGSGGGELLTYIDTAAYWQQQGVAEVSVETITAQMVEGSVEPAKIDEKQVAKLIDQLGSTDFDAREQASTKLVQMGEAVLPYLKKATESDDAEVALRAENLIGQIKGTGEKGDPMRVRRLMAIRTLGELKDKSAIPVLEAMTQSKRPFEADYARRAIAQINGTPYSQPKTTREQLDADLALLPVDVGVVGQMSGISSQTVPSISEMLKDVPLPEGIDLDQVKQEMNKAIVQAMALAGNFRLEAVTLGISAPMDGDHGFVIVVGRLQYDRPALEGMLQAKSGKTHDLGKFTVYQIEREMGLLLVDDSRIMLILAEDEQTRFEKMAKLIETGKETLAGNEAMGKLIAGVDKTADVWAVSKIDPSYKVAPYMQAFDTATLIGKRTENGNSKLTLNAVGADAEQVGASVEMIKQLIEQGKEEMKRAADTPMAPMMKPYEQMLNSITIAQDGKAMTMTLEMAGNGTGYLLSPLLMTMSMRPVHTMEAEKAAHEHGDP